MAKNNYITIPEPCSQNWQEMSVAEKGKFCGSCQKNVFDFTNASDREIATTFKNNKNVCGRFNISQLNRELIVPKERSSAWIIAATGLISFLGLGNNAVYAQEEIKMEQADTKKQFNENKTHKEKDTITVSGTIYDEQNIPLPGVSVLIKGTTNGTQTDYDGNYKIIAKEADFLVFSYIGLKTEETRVCSNTQSCNIVLKADLENITLGVFYIVPTQRLVLKTEKRTFFGRIFQSIGNIFR